MIKRKKPKKVSKTYKILTKKKLIGKNLTIRLKKKERNKNNEDQSQKN